MGDDAKKLYACCPVCTRAIGKSKRIDGLEMPCPKCGSPLKITIDEENGVSVKLVKDPPDQTPQKTNKSSATSRSVGTG